MPIILWMVFIILLTLWGVGLLLNLAGGFIHLLLIVALVILMINLISAQRIT